MIMLRALYEDKNIVLPELNGHRTIYKDREVFRLLKDERFKEINQRGGQTPKSEIVFYSLAISATFKEIFNSLSSDLNELCFTQHQIIKICENHREFLKPGYATFFLIKKRTFWKKSKYYVVFVGNNFAGLDAGLYEFEDNYLWKPDCVFFCCPKV